MTFTLPRTEHEFCRTTNVVFAVVACAVANSDNRAAYRPKFAIDRASPLPLSAPKTPRRQSYLRIGLVHLEALASCANAKPIIISNPTVSKAEVRVLKHVSEDRPSHVQYKQHSATVDSMNPFPLPLESCFVIVVFTLARLSMGT